MFSRLYLIAQILVVIFCTASFAAETKLPVAASVPSVEEEKNFPVGESETDNAIPPDPLANPDIKTRIDGGEKKATPTLPDLNEEDAHKNYTDRMVLQGLNKITARTSSLEVVVGKTIQFGTLEILARQCWKSSPDEAPDSKALLEIWEQKPGEEKTKLFSGWMLASSPAISALEHPVYDITVIECTNKALSPATKDKK